LEGARSPSEAKRHPCKLEQTHTRSWRESCFLFIVHIGGNLPKSTLHV
ncbi:hypothetical protein T05_4603, partial [Trichinella murrelli]